MEKTYIEVRRITCNQMRALCIQKGWYTGGTNYEYGHLLIDLCEHKMNLTTNDIVEIVEDIIEHTNRFYGASDRAEIFDSVAFEGLRIANVRLKEVEI